MMSAHRKTAQSIGVGALLIAIIAVPFVPVWRQMRQFDHAFQRYSSSLRNEAFQDAYDMADADFKAATSYAEFARIHQAMNNKFGRLRAVKTSNEVVEGRGKPFTWFAATDATLQFERGTIKFRYWSISKGNGNYVALLIRDESRARLGRRQESGKRTRFLLITAERRDSGKNCRPL